MAVDTQAKRFSMMGMQACGTAPLLPAPDGVIAQGDWYAFLDLYVGGYPVGPEGLSLLPLVGVGE